MLTTEQLKSIRAKEVRIVPKDAIFIGYMQASYGDWQYYIDPQSGQIIVYYFDIGD